MSEAMPWDWLRQSLSVALHRLSLALISIDRTTSRFHLASSQPYESDTGLYVCDYTGNPSDPLLANTALFLLVKAAGESCSCGRYSLLIYTITVGVSLLLLSGIVLFVTRYKKPYAQPENQTTAPIYEDMSSVKGKRSSVNCHRSSPPDPETSALGWKTMLENLY
ncbi:hypothetical protein Q8A67_000821 [Cirrhinus molitorella]|uniref:Uncharacterized protein n=1 Tax=Cirrhinus molitorella TaxID=172907 RepID=A0AA88TX55_9TELE|nr:hypothetical protein Q8A67_000821 [Cirrhinus molitorella]